MAGLFRSLVSGLRRGEMKVADASALTGLFSQPNVRSGVSVTIDSALKVSTVFACLRVLADGIAQVPLKVYREKADGTKELAKDHPAYRLLSRPRGGGLSATPGSSRAAMPSRSPSRPLERRRSIR